MGQYFILINETKREWVNPWSIGGLGKLFEWCANPQAGVIPYLLRKSNETGGGDVDDPSVLQYAGRWAGDKLMLVGDYDESGLYNLAEKEYLDISEGLIPEYNSFVQVDDLKLGKGGKPDFIRPDGVVSSDGKLTQGPKIDLRRDPGKMVFSETELLNLVTDALSELTRAECPHCSQNIGTDLYLSREDIREWLTKQQ